MGEPRLPEPLHEVFVLWDAYNVLTRYVSKSDPLTADPQSMHGAISAIGDRADAMVYARAIAETMEACTEIVNELLAMLRRGRRPRSPREVGISAEMLAGPKPGDGCTCGDHVIRNQPTALGEPFCPVHGWWKEVPTP